MVSKILKDIFMHGILYAKWKWFPRLILCCSVLLLFFFFLSSFLTVMLFHVDIRFLVVFSFRVESISHSFCKETYSDTRSKNQILQFYTRGKNTFHLLKDLIEIIKTEIAENKLIKFCFFFSKNQITEKSKWVKHLFA